MFVPMLALMALQTADVATPYKKLEQEGFSGAVLIVDQGKPAYRAGLGFRDPSAKKPMEPNAIFPIGSVTKWFTGLVVLKLEASGKVALDDPIGKYLNNVPSDRKSITIRHLLAHRSGLIDYVDRPGEGGDFAPIDKREALKRILGAPLRSKPGAKTEYSNAGYVLLAAIIEKATGESYEAMIRKHVIKPAGLKRTGFHGDQLAGPDHFAVGHRAKTHGAVNSPAHWPKPSWALKGSGGIVSTVDDLGLLIRAITENKIVPATHEPRLFQPLIENEGYGWIAVKNKAGNPFCNVAGGDDFGFTCVVMYMPTEGRLAVGFSSGNNPRKLGDALMESLRGLT